MFTTLPVVASLDRRQGPRRISPAGASPVVERRTGRDRRRAALPAMALALASSFVTPAQAQVNVQAPDAGAAARKPSASPLATARWYVDPYSSAKKQAEAWRATRPADAAQMDKIAATGGQANWFGDWNSDILAAIDQRVSTITAAGALPVLVAYNIPNRDCGQYSSGGAASASAYRDWIRRFALGINGRAALVVLEPDALGHLSQCGTEAQRQERLAILWDAVQVLKSDPRTLVYIDAGHSRWMSVDTAASRLQAAGVAKADGFALNVSNFNPSANEVAYGTSVAGKLGGKHFVVDTSRNGLGPAPEWCNPSGQALGQRPTAATGSSLVDAYLWVKYPGQSDGECNGGPRAGTWWPDYALGLAQRAAY